MISISVPTCQSLEGAESVYLFAQHSYRNVIIAGSVSNDVEHLLLLSRHD